MASKSKAVAKKPGFFAKCKEVFSELKRVTWPSFSKVVKSTCVVLVVVLVFLVVITGFNSLFQWLLDLITNAAK